MAQMQKPNPKNMVKIGDLRKIVSNLRKRQQQLEYNLEDVDMVDAGNKADFIERAANEDKIGRYSAILKKHDAKNPSQDIISKVIRIGKAIKNEF
jgi:hypothetical protein